MLRPDDVWIFHTQTSSASRLPLGRPFIVMYETGSHWGIVMSGSKSPDPTTQPLYKDTMKDEDIIRAGTRLWPPLPPLEDLAAALGVGPADSDDAEAPTEDLDATWTCAQCRQRNHMGQVACSQCGSRVAFDRSVTSKRRV